MHIDQSGISMQILKTEIVSKLAIQVDACQASSAQLFLQRRR